jgi:prevent-host-death family protein
MKIQEIGIFESKTHLSELIDKVQKEGVTYRITKRGKPVAELKPLEQPKKKYGLPYGYGQGTVTYMADDFDAPLDEMKDYM